MRMAISWSVIRVCVCVCDRDYKIINRAHAILTAGRNVASALFRVVWHCSLRCEQRYYALRDYVLWTRAIPASDSVFFFAKSSNRTQSVHAMWNYEHHRTDVLTISEDLFFEKSPTEWSGTLYMYVCMSHCFIVYTHTIYTVLLFIVLRYARYAWIEMKCIGMAYSILEQRNTI